MIYAVLFFTLAKCVLHIHWPVLIALFLFVYLMYVRTCTQRLHHVLLHMNKEGLLIWLLQRNLNTNFSLERNFADFRLDALVSLASSKYEMIDTGFASLKCLKLIVQCRNANTEKWKNLPVGPV